jgi:tetratricopeptide (TPR) repeat protein
MLDRSKQTFIAIAVIISGLTGVFGLSDSVEKSRPTLPETYADEDLNLQGARLKGFAFGFEGLLADWYWVRSLQYIGAKIVKNQDANENFNLENLSNLNPRLLYPLLDNAATLDPRFTAVYSYGAIVLPAIDRQQAIALTKKGIENNPNEWRLYGQLGYIYWRSGNYEKSAAAYEAGARVFDAPAFMQMMATKMKTEGADRATARAIYEQMLAASNDEQARENAARHLLQLDSLDERDAIRVALQSFKAQTNRCANNWHEILLLLQTVKLPNGKSFRIDASNNLVDPSGAPYILDKQICEVQLDVTKTKISLK